MGVRVDTTGADIHPIGMDDFFTALMADAAQGPNFPVTKGDICLEMLPLQANRSAFDDVIHDGSFFLISRTDSHSLS